MFGGFNMSVRERIKALEDKKFEITPKEKVTNKLVNIKEANDLRIVHEYENCMRPMIEDIDQDFNIPAGSPQSLLFLRRPCAPSELLKTQHVDSQN